MAEIRAGVLLSLKDLFSQGMNKAAGAASDFAGKTLGAIDKVDKAISGTGAKLAAFGLTLSAGAAAKGVIEMDHRLTRLGLSANASAEQISNLKQAVFDAAQAADVKTDANGILSGIEVIINKTNDLKYAEDNIRNIGLAIQATGESGEAIGDIFSEFQRFEYTSEQITTLMDDMVAMSNEGAFSLAEFAKSAPQIFSAYSVIGTAPENIKKANAALQIINAGTKSPAKATAAFNSAMNELCDTEKQKALARLGIRVRDTSGNFRDFNDIMFDIAKKSENTRYADYINKTFSASSMQAIRSYISHGERMYENLTDLGDTTGLLQQQSAAMAGTLQSNIRNLQTAFNKFADSNLSKPLSNLTDLLNKLSEDPERLKRVFTGAAVGIGAIVAVKGIAGISRFVGSLLQLKGGKINLGGALSMSTAMPVYVTNWGGMGGMPGLPGAGGPSSGMPGLPGAGRPSKGKGLTRVGSRILPFLRRAGPYAAFAASVVALSKSIDRNATAKYNIDGKHYSEWENQAREAIQTGDRESELEARIAALKIQIPEYEKLRAGFAPDEMFLHCDSTGGRMVTLDDLRVELQELQAEAGILLSDVSRMTFDRNDLPPQITQSASSADPQNAEHGQVDLNVNVTLTDKKPIVTVDIPHNAVPSWLHTNRGSRIEQRGSGL